MLQAISALQSAVTVLSKHNSFLQLPIESKENKLQAKETVEDNVRHEKAEADMIAEANVAREANAEKLKVEMRSYRSSRTMLLQKYPTPCALCFSKGNEY